MCQYCGLLYDDDNDEYQTEHRYYSRPIKRYAKPGVHYPAKPEAKVLRRLQAETGLSEQELREHKKYRIMLSDAQKEKGKKTWWERKAIKILKGVLSELKLPKDHPKVLERLRQRLEEHKKYQGRYFMYQLTAENIIKLY